MSPRPGASGTRLGDLVWVVACFVVLGVVAGLVWWQVVSPPTFVRTSDNAVMDQVQLGLKVRADGWFVVIGVVGSGVLGALLAGLRRRDPLLVTIVGTVASVLTGALALWLGQRLGHHDVRAELATASVGDRVPASLQVISRAVLLAWPIGFLLGDLGVLLGLPTQGAVASYEPDGGTPTDAHASTPSTTSHPLSTPRATAQEPSHD